MCKAGPSLHSLDKSRGRHRKNKKKGNLNFKCNHSRSHLEFHCSLKLKENKKTTTTILVGCNRQLEARNNLTQLMRSSSSYCNKTDLVASWIQSKTRVTTRARWRLVFVGRKKWKHQIKLDLTVMCQISFSRNSFLAKWIKIIDHFPRNHLNWSFSLINKTKR